MPSSVTLKKYGLSLAEWQSILDKQGGVCPVCLKAPTTNRWCIDHFHVKGWKNLPAEERKKFVRGILCWVDNNRILTRGVTSEKLRRAADYLDKWKLPPDV